MIKKILGPTQIKSLDHHQPRNVESFGRHVKEMSPHTDMMLMTIRRMFVVVSII